MKHHAFYGLKGMETFPIKFKIKHTNHFHYYPRDTGEQITKKKYYKFHTEMKYYHYNLH